MDNPNKQNYYEVYFRIQCHETNEEYFHFANGYMSSSPILLNEDILDYEPKSIIFSDELFNGEETNIPISFRYPCINSNSGGTIASDYSLVVYFLSITEEYYLYRKSLYKHLFSQQTDIWNGAIEPVNMYSNVNGGYGVFAGYSLITDTIQSFDSK